MQQNRKYLAKKISSLKHSGELCACGQFQSKLVIIVDKESQKETKLSIPGVSLRDEVSTDGCSISIIELTTMCGIASQDANYNMS